MMPAVLTWDERLRVLQGVLIFASPIVTYLTIPTHLLTTEAFDIYAKHLKRGGVLAVHFSNRSVDLGPLLLHHAQRLKMHTSVGDPGSGSWMLMSADRWLPDSPQMRRGTTIVEPTDEPALWTDDHVNLMQIIEW